MAEDKRPALRVVAPDEVPARPEPPRAERPAPETTPSAELSAFRAAVDDALATSLIGAAYLSCAGEYLADAAVAFYHQAVAHAPAGTFRHDVPPGLRSAEATRAWVGSHLDDLRCVADGAIDRPETYVRASDLRAAARHAADELTRALGAAAQAGLWFDERRAGLLRDAAGDIAIGDRFAREGIVAPEPEPEVDTYVFGLDALGGLLQ